MEPIFVDDFQNEEYPKSIQNILNFLEQTEPRATRNDVLIGLIYILMLETGFLPTDFKDDNTNSSFNLRKHLEYTKKLPDTWKKDGMYKLSFMLENFEENECVVLCSSNLDDLLINCYIKGIENGFTVYLDTLTYFSSSNVSIHNVRLQHLRGFSCKVKDNLCYPAKQAILKSHFCVQECLDVLPDELILLIMGYLRTIDLVKFGITSLHYNKIMRTPLLWFRRLIIDFGIKYNPSWQMMNFTEVMAFYQEQRNRLIRNKIKRIYFNGNNNELDHQRRNGNYVLL